MVRFRELLPAVFILLFYAVFAVWLKPWAMDFPLNDDWAYALGVRHLVQEGRLRLCDWGAPTQVVQILWGALWIKIFGWHLGVLKLSTLAAAVLGALFFNDSLKSLGLPPATRLCGTLLLAANPVYLCLGFSFMTDVPYMCLMLLSFSLYLRSEKTGSVPALARGSLAAAGAYLIRQIGLLVPLGYFLHLIVSKKLDLKKSLLLWGIPLSCALAHAYWFHFIHGPTWASENVLARWVLARLSRPEIWVPDFFSRLWASSLFLGAGLSPLAVAFVCAPRQFFRKKSQVELPSAVYFILAGYLFGCSIFLVQNGWMPHLENTLHRSGLGVLTVGGASFKSAGIFGEQGVWIVATLVAVFSGAMLLSASGSACISASPLEQAALRIFLISSLAQCALAMIQNKFFDRYTLVLLPAGLLVFALAGARWRWAKLPAYLV